MSNQDFQTFKIYTRVADELQNSSPIVTYYLKTYTLNKAVEYLKMERSKGQDVSSRTQEIKEWLSDLEKLKTIVNQDLVDREKCKLSYQTFTFTLFHESDRKFKSGELSRKLAKDFLYISVLFDAWELVGFQSEQIKEKKTYSNDARFKIMDAINKDNKPESLPRNNETEKKGGAPKHDEKETRDRKKTLDPLAKLNFDFTESIFIPKTTFDKLLEGIKPDVKIGFTNTQNDTENNPKQINTNPFTNEPPKNRLGIPMGRSIKLADNANVNANDHQNQNQPQPHFGGYQHPPYFPNNTNNDSNNSNPQQQQMFYQYPPPNQFNNGYYDLPPQQQQNQQPFFNGSGPQNFYNNGNNNNNNQGQGQGYLFPPVDYQNQPSIYYAPPRCLNSQNNLAPYYDSRLAYGPEASGAIQHYPQNSTQFQPSQPYNPYQQPSDQNMPYPQQQYLPPQNQPISRGAESQHKTANPYQPQDLHNSGNPQPINPYYVTPVGPESSGSSHPSNPYLPSQNSGNPLQGLGASNHKQSSELLKDFSVDTPSQDSLKKSSNIFAQNEQETSHQDTTNDTPTDPNPLTTSQKLTSTPGKANTETPQGTPEGDRVRLETTTPREITPEVTPEPSKQETYKGARIGKVISTTEAKNFCLLAASELDFNRLKEAKEKMYEALKIIEQLEKIQNH